MKRRRYIPRRAHFDTWQRWEYKHTTAVLISLLVFILLLDTALFTTVIEYVERLGYFGALIAGLFFVSLFTAAPAVITLLALSETGLNPVVMALVAGTGAMIGDYLILRFVEDKVAYELKPIATRIGIPQAVTYMQKRRHTSWLVRGLGAIVIATPLPDEIGIGLLGITKMSNVSFLSLCYVLNTIGILILLLIGRAV